MTLHLEKKNRGKATSSAKRVSSGNKKGKQSAYNKFLLAAMIILKETNPELDHAGRLKLSAERWKTDEHNPKSKAYQQS